MAGYVEDHPCACTAKGTKEGGAKKSAEKSATEGTEEGKKKGAEEAAEKGTEEGTKEGAEKAKEKGAEEITIGVVIANTYQNARGPS